VQITCVDCAATWSVPDMTIGALLADGSVVEKTSESPGWSYTGYFGVCENCQRMFKAAAHKKQPRNVDTEHRALMQLVAQTRESHPDWSLEKAVHECVAYVNDAGNEHDPKFRKWLLDHEL
jgi:DNA-binding transcriptional regulator GbsR (MarR family)